MTPAHPLLDAVRRVHRRIRDDVVRACEGAAALDALAAVASEQPGDTIYSIDRVAEETLVDEIALELGEEGPVILVAEGLEGGRTVVPRGAPAHDARWVVIVDPIDGTRGLMYQKRPAWILTGVAPVPPVSWSRKPAGAPFRSDPHTPEHEDPVHALAPALTLADIHLAVQTEIPLVKQHLCDELWAVRGMGAAAERVNRLTGARSPLRLRPSGAPTIAHGFAMLARFFPGTRVVSAEVDDEIAAAALGPPLPGKAQLFEDQYISSGGQLYELMAGHDRFVADLRPLFERAGRGGSEDAGVAGSSGDHASLAPALSCHPYDLCTELIARELGVIVTDEYGQNLQSPLDLESNCSWIGYANAAIRAQVEPLLRAALVTRGLLP